MSRRTKDGLQLGAVPTIDLTPPDVKARRQGAGLRRSLVMAFVGALVIVAAGYGAAFLRATAAAGELQTARDRTAQLLEQQQEFSDVMTIASRTKKITQTREQVSASEVVWKKFTDQLVGALPADSQITSIVAQGRLVSDPELVPVGVLRKPLVASVTIIVGTPGVPDAAAWSRRLSALPGYADHAITNSTLTEGRYLTTVSISLSADALAARFAPEEEPPAEEEPAEPPVEADGADTVEEAGE
ncbi:MAG TPA: hypothetical protein VN200_08150 [Rhodoglobus sp.]|nr:hypothetical protein [Rhodoglobus sp.]